MYEAIMQASKALMFLRQGQQMLFTKGLFYPVVVYKGECKLTDQNEIEMKNILYYHEYQWRDLKTNNVNTCSLYVNIIHETALEEYLSNVFKKEMDNLMSHVSFRNKMRDNNIRESARRKNINWDYQ